jgi:hypothetical protein
MRRRKRKGKRGRKKMRKKRRKGRRKGRRKRCNTCLACSRAGGCKVITIDVVIGNVNESVKVKVKVSMSVRMLLCEVGGEKKKKKMKKKRKKKKKKKKRKSEGGWGEEGGRGKWSYASIAEAEMTEDRIYETCHCIRLKARAPRVQTNNNKNKGYKNV